VNFRILGPLEAESDGRPISLPGGKQRALLAMLLLNANEVVPGDRLIEGLWGDQPPDTARTALQVHVSQLRKVLAPLDAGDESQPLVTRAPGYLIRLEPDRLDLLQFERLVREGRSSLAAGDPHGAAEALSEAVELWRGRPLLDVDHSSYLRLEALRLHELRLGAVEEQIDAELALGRHAAVVAGLEALVVEHPLRERLRGQLMLALYRSGRQAAALETYQAGRRRLSEELGLEPSEALQQLERRILNHDPSLDVVPPDRATVPRDRRAGRRQFSRRARLAAAVGILLAGGAVAATVLELTGGAIQVVPNSVAVIDVKSHKLVADIPVGTRPTALAVDEHGVWVVNAGDGTVSHIDPTTRKVVKTIGTGGELSDIVAGYGSVWVANGNDGTITRIDPHLDAVVATIRLGGENALNPQPVFSVATGERSIWATSGTRIVQINPETNDVIRRIPLGSVLALTVGDGAVWVTTISERMLRLEPTTGVVTAKISVPAEVSDAVAGGGKLWTILEVGRGEVWRFDPDSGTPSGTAHPGDSPSDLWLTPTALWVANGGDGTVARIDPASGQVREVGRVGQQPTAVAAGDGFVWVSVQPRAST
jgi:YVTN family beta-propeller protein